MPQGFQEAGISSQQETRVAVRDANGTVMVKAHLITELKNMPPASSGLHLVRCPFVHLVLLI